MHLDVNLLNESATWNHKVDIHLKKMPFYFQQETMMMHRKKLHTQPGIEINISHQGKAAIVVGKNIYMHSPRQLILIQGHIPHQVFPIEFTSYRRSVICMNDDGLRAEANDILSSLIDWDWFTRNFCRNYQLSPELYIKIDHILRTMNDEMKQQQVGWKRMILSQLLELTVLLQRNYQFIDEMEEVEEIGGIGEVGVVREQTHFFHSPRLLASNCVQLCCEYLENHLYEDLSLQRVAALFSVSPEHLTRLFRKEKGTSYYKYVMLQRMLEAKRLLQMHPSMSITDIAHSLGFTSSSRFSQRFKEFTFMTPTEFRAQFERNPVH